MKKNYISPLSKVVKLQTCSAMLSYSNSEAASNATVLSRDGGSVFDDEE